jgi:hypothetical protein
VAEADRLNRSAYASLQQIEAARNRRSAKRDEERTARTAMLDAAKPMKEEQRIEREMIQDLSKAERALKDAVQEVAQAASLVVEVAEKIRAKIEPGELDRRSKIDAVSKELATARAKYNEAQSHRRQVQAKIADTAQLISLAREELRLIGSAEKAVGSDGTRDLMKSYVQLASEDLRTRNDVEIIATLSQTNAAKLADAATPDAILPALAGSMERRRALISHGAEILSDLAKASRVVVFKLN